MKHKKIKLWVSLLLILTMLVLGGCSQSADKGSSNGSNSETSTQTVSGDVDEEAASDESAEITHEPELAPSFELKSLDGKTVTLEDYRGQYLFINFWATWCQYCDEEMPDLMAFQKKHAEELTVLAINVNEKNDVVQKYLDKNKLDLKVLLDSDGTVSQVYQVSAFPTTFLVDKAGKIIGYIPGKLTAEDMESTLKYLKEHETTK